MKRKQYDWNHFGNFVENRLLGANVEAPRLIRQLLSASG